MQLAGDTLMLTGWNGKLTCKTRNSFLLSLTKKFAIIISKYLHRILHIHTHLCRLNAANFPIWILPRVTCVPSYAGMLPVSWHCIPQGTPVSVAMGDLQCSILATKPTSTDASKQ